MTLEQGAAVFLVTATVQHALIEQAKLRRGESVLVHSAAGATGQMAVQLARAVSAEVYATAGSEAKKWLLAERYGVPEQRVFNSRGTSFAKGVGRMTNGRGVDVVLNSLSGEGLETSWEVIAPCGRFIELGKGDILANNKLAMTAFEENVTFSAVDLFKLFDAKPDTMHRLSRSVSDLLTSKAVSIPYPLQIFPASAVEEAFRLMQGG